MTRERTAKPVWDSPEERERAIAAAKAYPRQKGEGPLAYVARLAELAQLAEAEQETLPLREPGQEG